MKISDKHDYSRFVWPNGEDEGIWLDHVEVHLVTYPVGQVIPADLKELLLFWSLG